MPFAILPLQQSKVYFIITKIFKNKNMTDKKMKTMWHIRFILAIIVTIFFLKQHLDTADKSILSQNADENLTFYILTVFSVVGLLISIFYEKIIFRSATKEDIEKGRFSAFLVKSSIASTPIIYAILVYMMYSNPTQALLLCAISIINLMIIYENQSINN